MKAHAILLILVLSMLAPIGIASATETVGAASYTYIGPCDFDLSSVATVAKQHLESRGFVAKASYSVSTLGGSSLLDVIDSYSDYGGILIWVSHGLQDMIQVESFADGAAGKTAAQTRRDMLIAGGQYTADQLALGYSNEAWGTWHWGLYLTESGLNMSGDASVAAVFACFSSTTGNAWGARVMVGYPSTILNTTAETEAGTFFSDLTAQTDYDDMTVTKAMVGTNMTVGAGNTDTALYPWVTGFSPPEGNLLGGEQDIMVSFGTTMNTAVADPFYFGGVCVQRGDNKWENDTTAKLQIYSGWARGDIIAGFAAYRVESANGIPLLNGQDFYLNYYAVETTWPPAASVNSFAPVLTNGGVRISIDFASMKGMETFWVERADGSLVEEAVDVRDVDGHKFILFDPNGRKHDEYMLKERDFNGNTFVRMSERAQDHARGVTIWRAQVDGGNADTRKYEFATEKADADSWEGVIICPDSFATSSQILANYWTWNSRPVKVVPLSESGSTRDDIKSYIQQEYAQGVRYVLLVGSASDHEWYDDVSKWPDLPGDNDWYHWYVEYHTPGGTYYYVSQPERDLVPTWYFDDPDLDNMSYWTPYYAGDWFYGDGVPDLRIGRFPVNDNTELMNLISKTIHYCDVYSWSVVADYISLWGQCHDWDENPGEAIEILMDDLAYRMPPDKTVYKLYDKNWDYPTREAIAIADWDQGRGYIYMRGTSSTSYRPLHFFSKPNGWHVGLLAGNQAFPIVIGASCGIGTYEMAQNPDYGNQFAVDILCADPLRGTCLLIGPTRGTWMEGNRQMTDALTEFLIQSPAADVGTAFMQAQQQVMAGDHSLTAESFNLLGDPMAPIPEVKLPTGKEPRTTPAKYALLQNRPNPFNPTTSITYSVAMGGHVNISVYNVAGQLVDVLVSETREAGHHTVVWNASGVSSGVYFCLMRAGNYTQTTKLVVLK